MVCGYMRSRRATINLDELRDVTCLVRGEHHSVDQAVARLAGASRDELSDRLRDRSQPESAFRADLDVDPADQHPVTMSGDGILRFQCAA
jgi:hypothetical protein